MNTINHALWGAVIGQVVGNPLGGAMVGSLPDLLTIPEFTVLKVKGTEPHKAPRSLLRWYEFVHNWWVALLLTGLLFSISKSYGVLGLAYLLHVIEDAFVHTQMATRFLYPVWKGRIQRVSAAESKWVQVVDLVVLGLVYVLLFRAR